MSLLFDESFPGGVPITPVNCKNNGLLSSSSPNEIDQNSSSGLASSGTSHETTQSDPIKTNSSREEQSFNKTRSCQELHSSYTNRKYLNVKSKVREYIEGHKEHYKMNRATKRSSMRGSFLESTTQERFEDTSGDCTGDVLEVLARKEQEMNSLKAFNEYLQSSLQDRIIEANKLRRNVEIMRFELMDAKDKAKRHSLHDIGPHVRRSHSPRLSLPILNCKLARNTTGTQTDFDGPPLKKIIDINNNSTEFYSKKLTKSSQTSILSSVRLSSQDTLDEESDNLQESEPLDSAIDTENGSGESSSGSKRLQQFGISDHSINNSISSQLRRKKKKRYFRRKLRWIFGPCAKCDEKRNNSMGEQYSQAPLLDSHQSRPFTDSTT